jgi:transposase-like protein
METLKWVDRQKLHEFIHKTTAPETENIYTDEHPGYRGIQDEDTKHGTVNHSQEEWVHGDIHTNGIESVWSLLKRSIVGSYHKVSVKHLDAYLQELEHRFNNRDNKFLFRDTLLKLVKAEKLTYSELTKGEKV